MFDDFFETVQKKSTDLDAPEPEWKYLSGFAIQKGQPKPSANGPLGNLLAPRRGPTTTAHPPTNPPTELTIQQQLPMIQPDNDNGVTNVDDPPLQLRHHNRPPLKHLRTAPYARHAAAELSPILLGTTKV